MTAADTSRIIRTEMIRFLFLTAVLLAGLGGGVLPTQAQQPPQLMIVFDGSGSMWGRLSGSPRSKLAALRVELSQALRQKRPNIAVGLTTFGARSGGSCTSAATPFAPAPGQFDRLDQALASFNPQGRGPVVLGLRTAAAALGASAAPQRLLLIHDSLDNCSQDVCAFARDLAAKQPAIAVDVLSLGRKPKDQRAMGCRTKATGGRLVNAATMDAAIAGINTIIAALNSAPPVAATRPSAAVPSAASPAQPPPKTAGLALTARLAGTKTIIQHGISWQIKSRSKLDKPVDATVHQAALDIALLPATYQVVLNTELVRMTKQIEVRKDVRKPVVFDVAGGLVEVVPPTVSAQPAAAAAEAGAAAVSVVRTSATSGNAAEAVWSGPASAARALLLTSGFYRVTVGNGLSQVSRTINVATGSSQKVGFEIAPAHLNVVAAGLDPKQIESTEIHVARKLADQPDGRLIVARSAAASASFELPPGQYYVTLRTHGTEITSLIILAAGETVTHTPRLLQMALRVTSHVGKGPKLGGTNLRYRVWPADALLEPIASSRMAQPVFHLAPGKYRIESRIGHQNAVMIREFDVGTAAAGSLELRHRAGQVSFAAPSAARRQRQIAYWEVLDPDNRLIWRSFAPSPTATLAAGTYKVTMATKEQQFSTDFIVVAGRTDTVTLQSK